MSRRPSDREVFWRQLIARQASSRLTVGELCRQAGVSMASFNVLDALLGTLPDLKYADVANARSMLGKSKKTKRKGKKAKSSTTIGNGKVKAGRGLGRGILPFGNEVNNGIMPFSTTVGNGLIISDQADQMAAIQAVFNLLAK